MKYIIILFIYLGFLSCSSENVNKEIQPIGIFTAEENDEITEMLTQFRDIICESKSSISKCTKDYFQNYWENYQEGRINTNIDSNELKKILNPLSKELKAKLFIENMSTFDNRIPNTSPPLNLHDSINHIGINYHKSFSPMLQELAKRYPHLKPARAC